jgi:hypothetical protein
VDLTVGQAAKRTMTVTSEMVQRYAAMTSASTRSGTTTETAGHSPSASESGTVNT